MGAGSKGGATVSRTAASLALFLALALGGQALSDRAVPQSGEAATIDAVGNAGFAYLSGFRIYAAAVLWNRLDPIMHGYFSGARFRDLTFMVPTIKAVVTLNPQFTEAYYVGAWIVASKGHVDEGVGLARDGVEANPDSGLLRVNYAELLEIWGDDLPAAYEQAKIAMDPDMEWRDAFEQHDSYAVIGSIMRLVGDEERVAQVEAEIERLDEELGDALPEGSHDHDGDGVPDH